MQSRISSHGVWIPRILTVLFGVTVTVGCALESTETDSEPTTSPTFTEAEQPMPGTTTGPSGGRFTRSLLSINRACGIDNRDTDLGSLRVEVPEGAETYFVQLRPRAGSWDMARAIIGPGDSATIKNVPACDGQIEYDLVYAAGTEWFGFDSLFGPTGAYAQADETFTFEDGKAWEVSLTLVPGGNLGADSLDYSDFPK